MSKNKTIASRTTNALQEDAQAHYERVSIAMLQEVWARRRLIAATVAGALALAAIGLSLREPRYVGEAVIRPTFIQADTTSGTRSRPVAVMDASAVVNSAARLIRSRAFFSAIVTRLGLDHDPRFVHPTFSQRLIDELRSISAAGLRRLDFRLGATIPPGTAKDNDDASFLKRPAAAGVRGLDLQGLAAAIEPKITEDSHDVAVDRLIDRTKVTNGLRSYLIKIAVTANDPARAARFANAIAAEFSREQAVEQVTQSYAMAQQELADLSAIYGSRHPTYLDAKARVEKLAARLRSLRATSAGPGVAGFDDGLSQSLLPAEKVMVPTGPSTIFVLIAAILIGLGGGIGLVLLLSRRHHLFALTSNHERTDLVTGGG